MQARILHKEVFSTVGTGRMSNTFKEKEFNSELAPKHATIEHFSRWGRKYVRMTSQHLKKAILSFGNPLNLIEHTVNCITTISV